MTTKQLSKPELLAPAGDLERAKTAIRYGADAVYLGGKNFSLRSRASNFELEDIRKACEFARAHHARIHVTVNMIPHDEDFEGLRDYLRCLQDYGVTAIIAASAAVMRIAEECAPKLEIHCSTQLSVTNSAAASFLVRQLNADRVVLARECSIEDVFSITSHCPAETECFIHGGMCVNYSGRCTLSNRMTNRDANRGGCAQSCRWQYQLYADDKQLSDADTMLTMGSKDLMAAVYIKNLMAAGVSSLKIEGRMKSEYYVASIVSGYRHLIDELYESDGNLSKERMAYHISEILKGENRETWAGFYGGCRDVRSLIYHENSNSHVNHDFLGTIRSYDKQSGTAEMITRNPIDVGDTIEILRPGKENVTFVLSEMKNERGEYLEKCRTPMRVLTIPVPFETEKDDIIRKA